LTSVDLPALGAPMRATTAARLVAGVVIAVLMARLL